jgi:hypothetical protein
MQQMEQTLQQLPEEGAPSTEDWLHALNQTSRMNDQIYTGARR